MKEWREKKYVFGYFYLIWKDKILCLHTLKKRDQNQCSSLSKIYLVGEVDFKVFENGFKKGKEASRHRVKKRSEVVRF